MWRSADGVLHTVALPDPRPVFSARTLRDVESMIEGLDDERFQDAVEDAELELVEYWSSRAVDPEAEVPFDAAPVSPGTFDVPVADSAELLEALRRIEPRWRLDVLMALQDLLDVLLPDP